MKKRGDKILKITFITAIIVLVVFLLLVFISTFLIKPSEIDKNNFLNTIFSPLRNLFLQITSVSDIYAQENEVDCGYGYGYREKCNTDYDCKACLKCENEICVKAPDGSRDIIKKRDNKEIAQVICNNGKCLKEINCCLCQWQNNSECDIFNNPNLNLEDIKDPLKICPSCSYTSSPFVNPEEWPSSLKEACESIHFIPHIEGIPDIHDCIWNESSQKKCMSRFQKMCLDNETTRFNEIGVNGEFCNKIIITTDNINPQDILPNNCNHLRYKRYGHGQGVYDLAEDIISCTGCIQGLCVVEDTGCATFQGQGSKEEIIDILQENMGPDDKIILTVQQATSSGNTYVTLFISKYNVIESPENYVPCDKLGFSQQLSSVHNINLNNQCYKIGRGEYAFCFDENQNKLIKKKCCPAIFSWDPTLPLVPGNCIEYSKWTDPKQGDLCQGQEKISGIINVNPNFPNFFWNELRKKSKECYKKKHATFSQYPEGSTSETEFTIEKINWNCIFDSPNSNNYCS